MADWFDGSYYSHSASSNPKGPENPTTYRSMRGGSYINTAGFLASSGRGYYNPDKSLGAIGIRCAMNP